MQFPKSVHLEIKPELSLPGRMGAVEAAHQVMTFHGDTFDFEELAVASSAAVANYIFDPNLNQYEGGVRLHSSLCEYFSNYGIFESLSHYTGWGFGELNGIEQNELKKLLMFELSQGRPVMTYGVGGQLEAQIIIGFERDLLDMQLEIISPSGRSEFELKENKLQGESQDLVNYVVLVRNDEREWLLTPERQRQAVLRWATKHWRNEKEFFHETRENYAPGLGASRAFGELLGRFSNTDEWAFAAEHLAGRRRARVAFSNVLRGWDSEIAGLADVALAVDDAAAALGRIDLADPASYSGVSDLEAAWVERLETIVAKLPSPFG